MDSVITGYFKAIRNPDVKDRFEVSTVSGDYELFYDVLMNKRGTNKGGLSFKHSIPYGYASTSTNGAPVYWLHRNGGNITGLKGDDLYKYFGDIQNPKTKEKTNDAVLILVSPSFNEIELFVCPNMKSQSGALYEAFKKGYFDKQIQWFRNNSEVIYRF